MEFSLFYHTVRFFEGKKFLMRKVNAYAFSMLSFIGIGLLIGGMLLSGCAATPIIGKPVDHLKLKDGIYEGSYKGGPNKASVKVTIKHHSIVHIEIIENQAWKGKKAEMPIVERIIESQSTKVDAVSGATNSSRVIMNAVHKAIEKAYQN
jgi:uncharacterized protein with FMN-binding domain